MQSNTTFDANPNQLKSMMKNPMDYYGGGGSGVNFGGMTGPNNMGNPMMGGNLGMNNMYPNNE
jgi:hypothetical protein